MSNLTAKFNGTDALTGSLLSLNRGTNVDNVVSFELLPIDDVDDGDVDAVCVKNIWNTGRIIGK